MIDCPQLLIAVPQAFPLHGVRLSATHVQVDGVPWHVWSAAHAPQLVDSQPLLRSVGTHLPLQALVPGPHVPTTHAPPWQSTVPAPASGQAAELHELSVHP